jgi:outer membrane receptor protein involved in Fe transport
LPTTPGELRVQVEPDAADLDGDGNREELIPARDAAGSLQYVRHQAPGDVSLRNSERQTAYQRLDGRLSWNPRRGRWQLYLDVMNVLNRQVDDYSMLPFLPSFGVRARF